MTDKQELEKLKKTFEEFIKTSSQLQKSYEVLKEESRILSIYLSNILENLNSSILVLNMNKEVVIFNSRSIEIFPMLKEFGNKNITINDLKSNSLIDIEKVFENLNQKIEYENNYDGNERYFEAQSMNFIDSNSKKMGYIVIVNEITELKLLQKRAQQEDRLRVMGELAAEVAHEIRNPLGSIELMISLLEEDLKESKKSSDLLLRIRSSVNNMNHIVSNILVYTREIKPDYNEINTNDLLDETINMCIENILKKDIRLEKEIDCNNIYGDFELLKQSLANILLNATHAVDKMGYIKISVYSSDNNTVFEIKDNGKGIDSKIINQIFNPFFTTKTTGTGLGLAMVKRVVEAHNGLIEVDSDKNGTLFKIKIPLKY